MNLQLPRRPRFVDFENRAFTDEEMRHLGTLDTIVRLDFKRCPVGDDHIRHVCQLPKLESLWLEGTKVTDGVLEAVATIRSLNWLVLDDTPIKGSGFRHFDGHPKLSILWINRTQIDDAAVAHLARIPNLSTLVMKGTRITVEGLLGFATSPLLSINAGEQFSKNELMSLRVAQLKAASRTPLDFVSAPEEESAAKAILSAFFEAMAEWETKTGASAKGSEVNWHIEELQALFQKYCTDKAREYGRPNALSYTSPSEYKDVVVLLAEWLAPKKVVFYTQNRNDDIKRYLLVKKGEEWRIDHREAFLGKWTRDYL